METSTIISLVSLVVAIMALPFSYWIAVKQVKVSLDEYEHRNNALKQNVVADSLDEFFNVFQTILKDTTGIDASEFSQRSKEIDPHLKKIDEIVLKTGVLNRLQTAIDELASIEYADLSENEDIIKKLQSIRSQISLASDDSRYATLGVISAWGGGDIQKLRKKT